MACRVVCESIIAESAAELEQDTADVFDTDIIARSDIAEALSISDSWEFGAIQAAAIEMLPDAAGLLRRAPQCKLVKAIFVAIKFAEQPYEVFYQIRVILRHCEAHGHETSYLREIYHWFADNFAIPMPQIIYSQCV